FDRASRRHGDEEPDRRRGRDLARGNRRPDRPAAPLRQAPDAARPQDGPRDPAVAATLERDSSKWNHVLVALAGLAPATHVFRSSRSRLRKTWTPGSSPGEARTLGASV